MQLFTSFQQVRISHIFREGNTMSDELATWAVEPQSNNTFSSAADPPQAVQGALFMDKIGLPGLRRWYFRISQLLVKFSYKINFKLIPFLIFLIVISFHLANKYNHGTTISEGNHKHTGQVTAIGDLWTLRLKKTCPVNGLTWNQIPSLAKLDQIDLVGISSVYKEMSMPCKDKV